MSRVRRKIGILLSACLLAAVAGGGRAAEPFRLTLSPDRTAWSLEERSGTGWRPVLTGARVKAVNADGSDVAFSGMIVSAGGQSIVADAPDFTLKIIFRWLDAKRLPGTVVLLPEAYARRTGVQLSRLSVLDGAAAPPLGQNPMALSIAQTPVPQAGIQPLEEGAAIYSEPVVALHGPTRTCVAGYLSARRGTISLTAQASATGVTIADRSDFQSISISTASTGTSFDALYLAIGRDPARLLKRYASAARAYSAALGGRRPGKERSDAPVVTVPASRWKSVLSAARRLESHWWQPGPWWTAFR